MLALANALDRILNWLEQHRPSDVSLLQPGLSDEEIDELITDLPLKLPNDIRELYKWRNGTIIVGNYEEFAWTFEFWAFYPLQIVIDGYRQKIELNKKQYRQPTWEFQGLNTLNIFFSPELVDIGYVLIDDKNQEASPVIFEYCKGGACSPIIKYASLTNMLLTIAEIYEKGFVRIATPLQGVGAYDNLFASIVCGNRRGCGKSGIASSQPFAKVKILPSHPSVWLTTSSSRSFLAT